MDLNKTCSTCRFWDEFQPDRGNCRRKSPGETVLWPVTASDDWCGSFGGIAPKEVRPKADGVGRPKQFDPEQVLAVVRRAAPTKALAISAADVHRLMTAEGVGMSHATAHNYLRKLCRSKHVIRENFMYHAPLPATASAPETDESSPEAVEV